MFDDEVPSSAVDLVNKDRVGYKIFEIVIKITFSYIKFIFNLIQSFLKNP